MVVLLSLNRSSFPATEGLSGSLFHEVIITNTIPVSDINTIFSSKPVGEIIWHIHDDSSEVILRLARR
ncbi:unnamed protein product [Sphenostylis stenocarpa]|uniref:Uncharacterized protein n=1 Tax=Sphenostylis stenocarpa TaxID=92480 RepID=A0AA86RTE5_9FABA|nr:unnamed protein product [Sphenostylis stenocarpa]